MLLGVVERSLVQFARQEGRVAGAVLSQKGIQGPITLPPALPTRLDIERVVFTRGIRGMATVPEKNPWAPEAKKSGTESAFKVAADAAVMVQNLAALKAAFKAFKENPRSITKRDLLIAAQNLGPMGRIIDEKELKDIIKLSQSIIHSEKPLPFYVENLTYRLSEIESRLNGLSIAKTHLGGFSETHDTHPLFKKGVLDAVHRTHSYTPGAGIPECRALQAEYCNLFIKRGRFAPYTTKNVMMVSDAKAGIDAFLSAINPAKSSDEKWILTMEVGYPNYFNVAKAKGFTLMTIPVKKDEKGVIIGLDLTIQTILSDPRLRGIIYNSGPHNPLGLDMGDQVKDLARLINAANALRLSNGITPVQVLDDVAYVDISDKHPPYEVLSSYVEQAIMLTSFSKAFRTPASRGGALVSANTAYIEHMASYISNKSLPNLYAQKGAQKVLGDVVEKAKRGDLSTLRTFHGPLSVSRKWITNYANQTLKGLGLFANTTQDGGVFVCIFLDPERYESDTFQKRLMDMGVPVTTNRHFGDPKDASGRDAVSFIRIAIGGHTLEELQEALNRIRYTADHYHRERYQVVKDYFKGTSALTDD